MNPIDVVEYGQALANLAEFGHGFFVALVEQGFTPDQALALTQTWLVATLAQPVGE